MTKKKHASESSESNLKVFSTENVHFVLRTYVDDATLKVPRLVAEQAEEIFSLILKPTGARFKDSKKRIWDINAEPEGGLKLVGVPLWGPEVNFDYR